MHDKPINNMLCARGKIMINPWLKIPTQAPFVLEEDKLYVESFNYVNKKDSNSINLNYTPEPRLGPVEAPVIILQLNPSYSDESEGEEQVCRNILSIKDENHYHLGAAASSGWWEPLLRELANDVGNDLLSKSICSIEFFPYRSKQFSHGQIRLPSQQYTFSLVRKGLERNALFIVTRNLSLWYAAIPELRAFDGELVFSLNNPQRSYFTKGNLPDGVYKKIVQAIRESA